MHPEYCRAGMSNPQPAGCMQTASNVTPHVHKPLTLLYDLHTLTILFILYAAQDSSSSYIACPGKPKGWTSLL